MKKFAFLALFLSLGLINVGCKPAEKPKPATPAAGTSTPADKMPADGDKAPADGDKAPEGDTK